MIIYIYKVIEPWFRIKHENISTPNQITNLPTLCDLNQSITVRKGVRSYTKHLIRNFVSYGKLTPTNHAHFTSLIEVQNLNNNKIKKL